MRRLSIIVAVAAVSFSGWAVSAEPLSVVLEVERDCATAAHETALISELRFRLPEATVILGNTEQVEADWRVGWSRGDDSCAIAVERIDEAETQELAMPDESKPSDIELAASQIAWILTMYRAAPAAPAEPGARVAADLASTVDQPPGAEPVDESEAGVAGRADEPPESEESEGPEEPESEEPEPAEAEAAEEPVAPAPEDTLALTEPAEELDYQVVGKSFSLYPGHRWPRSESKRVVPRLSIGLIANHNWGVNGFEFATVYNRETRFMKGMQIALAFNRVGFEMGGMQIALGANFVDGRANGMQFALGHNSASDQMDGMQLALGANSAGKMRGIQTAFAANTADDVDGLQVAFGVNVADDVDGVQVSLVNVADRVDGVQVGLVNVSETADVPVGLVNIMTDEPLYFTGHTTFSGFTTVGLMHGGKRLRYLYLAGFQAIGDTKLYGAGLGLSLHSSLGRFFADPEWIVMQVTEDSLQKVSFLSMLRLSMGWQFAERFSVFVAPSATLLSTGSDDGLGLVPGFSDPRSQAEGSPTVWIYPELHLGFRF